MRKMITALMGVSAVLAVLVSTQPAEAAVDRSPPAVSFRPGIHFITGQVLSDTTSRPTVLVAKKWRQSDASGICTENATVSFFDDSANYTVAASTNHVQTWLRFRSTAATYYDTDITAADCSAAASSTSVRDTNVWFLDQETASTVTFSAGWKVGHCTCWSGGSIMRSTQAGQTVTYTQEWSSFALITDHAPGRGRADVYIDGVKRGSINDNGPRANRVVDFAANSVLEPHTVTIVVTSGRIDIDGFVNDDDS
jgi:hypothetical protein